MLDGKLRRHINPRSGLRRLVDMHEYRFVCHVGLLNHCNALAARQAEPPCPLARAPVQARSSKLVGVNNAGAVRSPSWIMQINQSFDWPRANWFTEFFRSMKIAPAVVSTWC
ncbi:hypothetical protein INH39_31970 [Massilia violaceinigra]|uniref:Uncharacterized protein n=1 Tax=Massilia violaceinigra TaxID=2045208 RepID=A0ABY4AFX3_9BURK|nr:hypothetical protein [Massilia violaceinigra]UOD33693.1 hypothetical protein INH39_31970 [Massilia violaceinigra]